MSGEADLNTLIAAMDPVLDPELYVFATGKPDDVPPGIVPRMLFHEAEGVTVILPQNVVQQTELTWDFPCRMITLNIHSALDAVGFLARVTSVLARLDMGVNPVSAFFHDHIFVPQDRAEDALNALRILSQDVTTELAT